MLLLFLSVCLGLLRFKRVRLGGLCLPLYDILARYTGMRLTDVLTEDNIIADLMSHEKVAALDEVVTALASRTVGLDRPKALDAILQREKLGTTGIGHGVAVPHGKIKGLSEIIVCFARSRQGVNFDSMDRMPVHLIFLIVAPENAASAHLKALAAISHLLKSLEFRNALMKAASPADIYRAIVDEDRKALAL